MNSRTMSALVVGVAMGALSSLPSVNLALCVWVWLGGILAVVLARILGTPRLTRAEGFMLGLLTGTVAGVVTIGFTLTGVGAYTEIAQQAQSAGDSAQRAVNALQTFGMLETLAGCVSLGLHIGGGALGGVVGAALTAPGAPAS